MEIRGIGIIDVQSIFGIRSIRVQKRVEVQCDLRVWEAGHEYDRTGLDEQKTSILGLEIPLVIIPIVPGKNITVIAEVVALNYLTRAYGYHPAEKLNRSWERLLANQMHDILPGTSIPRARSGVRSVAGRSKRSSSTLCTTVPRTASGEGGSGSLSMVRKR